MTDYISREEALFALRKAERGGSMTALTRLERAYTEIREMPAADVAEVVRCKDCKHKVRTDANGIVICSEEHGMYCPTENDFCSHGEYLTNIRGNDDAVV